MTTEVTAASRPATDDPVLVHADSAVVKRFGDWTTARQPGLLGRAAAPARYRSTRPRHENVGR